ncbi:MAG TPA: type II and III secretion system protein, partial [Longimicrobium sp.]|nr:type II and III secretion system protein [Longimicrobium sp.]
VLQAGESRDHVTIVDRPVVLAANNQPAKIVVGEQRPFVQLERATDGGVLDQVVQYKDVGTTLEVLPTISADGYVQLQVLQEVNSASGFNESLNAPIISTRSISTELLVRDGQTAVLGGLSGVQMDRGSGGVPVLSSLPLVGGLFGRKSRRNTDSELFVFLTPRVIYTDDDLTETTSDVRTNTRHVRKATGRVRPIVTPKQQPEPAAPAPAPAPAVPQTPPPPQP